MPNIQFMYCFVVQNHWNHDLPLNSDAKGQKLSILIYSNLKMSVKISSFSETWPTLHHQNLVSVRQTPPGNYTPPYPNAKPKYLKSPAFIPLYILKWPICSDMLHVNALIKDRPCPGPLFFTWMSHHFKNFQRERLGTLNGPFIFPFCVGTFGI